MTETRKLAAIIFLTGIPPWGDHCVTEITDEAASV
jgi:hypothetical protein